MQGLIFGAIMWYLIFFLALLALLTLVIQKLGAPIAALFRPRRTDPPLNRDETRLAQERAAVIEQRQESYLETNNIRERRRRERELEKMEALQINRPFNQGQRLGYADEEIPTEEDLRQIALIEERSLREEQDREYIRSLKADQDKESKIRAQKQAQETKKSRIQSRKEELEKNWPEKSQLENVCQVAIRLPNGDRIQRKFEGKVPIRVLFLYVESTCGLEPDKIQLVTSLPRRVYQSSEMTLQEADLTPKAVLLVEEL
eukprot:TRINITY_DN724_c0_g2_i1.p1 TRINITY_DN724_c0_g2~~TRINITY_DN724_c0_g2_i1.p1  ORF type:complete len:259 (-),score=78.41 TRINITY_DN724_c0_g2_i1:84-860(-)